MHQEITDYVEGAIEFRAPGLLKVDAPVFIDGSALPNRLSVPRVCAVSTNTKRFLPVNGFDALVKFHDSDGFIASQEIAARAARWANYLWRNNIRGLFVFNTVDAQPWDYRGVNPMFDVLPVWQYVRPTSSAGSVFLFPLDSKYAGPGTRNLPMVGFDDVPFRQKIPRVFWRGAPNGTCFRNGKMRWLMPEMRNYLASPEGPSGERIDRSTLLDFLRVRVVDNLCNSPVADVAFSRAPVGVPDVVRHEALNWFREPAAKSEQSRFKYLLALEGNDIPTGIYWSLASNSIVLVPQRGWETALDFGLQPGVHYVPTGDTAEDIENTIELCEADVAMCESIIDNAHRFIDRITDINLRDTIDFEVATRYSNRFRELFGREDKSLYAI